jgi:very-short-patch-repair endonuclease
MGSGAGPATGERVMWSLLRFQAPGWTREYSTGRYRLDFYCPEARLAVEVDGLTHHHGRQAKDRDRARDAWTPSAASSRCGSLACR